MSLQITGAASGIAANNPGCGDGPQKLAQSPLIKTLGIAAHWHPFVTPQQSLRGPDALQEVARLCREIAKNTSNAIQHQEKFLTLGGDHSCAIGTWSGAATAIAKTGALGLIWFDAHMDSHTMKTTPSGNIHGMPLATLLGYGDPHLTHLISSQPKLLPENVVLIGVRSYENAEVHLLEKIGVTVFYMKDIKNLGFQSVMEKAVHHVTKNTARFGISIDLDGIDPTQAPAVGVPESDGVNAKELIHALPLVAKHPLFLGAEIVEFNPHLDQEQKTEKIIAEIIEKLFC